MDDLSSTPGDIASTKQRLEFETLLSDTSASLFAAPPELVEPVIERALGRLRTFFHADRCALLTVSADQQFVNVLLASYADGVSPVTADLNLAPLFPWSRHTLLVARAPVRVPRMADLPPEADGEREIWIQMPIRSALSLPIETGGHVRHLIVLNTVYRENEWPDVFVTRLRLLGELIVGAIERKAMLIGLRASEARLASGADLAGLAFAISAASPPTGNGAFRPWSSGWSACIPPAESCGSSIWRALPRAIPPGARSAPTASSATSPSPSEPRRSCAT